MATTMSSKTVELVSKPTRRELCEYFVGTTLRIIDESFTDAGVDCDLNFTPNVSGQRRTLVHQYYHTLDFSIQSDVRKFLAVYEAVLLHLESAEAGWNGGLVKQTRDRLLKLIERDGFQLRDGRLISMTGALPNTSALKTEAISVDSRYILVQVERIENEVDIDPRHAIGAAKELVETTYKSILRERGIIADRKWELMDLVKETRKQLKLVPDEIADSARAADTIRRLLSNLATIVQSLAELRNSYGSGHGPDGRFVGLQPRHARLAAGAACVLSQFLFETHSDLEAKSS
jgi:Abortive infection C-terminus